MNCVVTRFARNAARFTACLFSLAMLLGPSFSAPLSAATLATIYSFAGFALGASPQGRLTLGNDGNFYGTTANGGTTDHGAFFQITPGGVFTLLHSFLFREGAHPLGALIQGSDGNFYGTASDGGANDQGVVFKITSGGIITDLYSFSGPDGSHPSAGLVQAGDGNFYGTTEFGGASGRGVLFSITPAGVLTILHNFTGPDGANPAAALIQTSNGNIYGSTVNGGANNYGTVFQLTPNGAFSVLYAFNGPDGSNPRGPLVVGSDGNFYGTTESGGTANSLPVDGTVFKLTPGGSLTTLHSFGGADGANPLDGLYKGTDGNFYGTTSRGGSTLSGANYGFGTVFTITPAGNLTTLHSLAGNDGSNPSAGVAQGTDGNFYGATRTIGGVGGGTVYQITAGGAFTVLHSFVGTEGSTPFGSLVTSTDGSFYGTSVLGGTNDLGGLFNFAAPSTFTQIFSFNGMNGALPYAGLIHASDGYLYGTTALGGTGYTGYNGIGGGGDAFRTSTAGTQTILHNFGGAPPDGSLPVAGLVQATDGNFYGTTLVGGQYGFGSVFKQTTAGVNTVLYSFNVSDGAEPSATLVQGTDGSLYGTTLFGGDNGAGTIYKITTGGSLTTLHSFAVSEGSVNSASLIQAADHNFYGTTFNGGANGDGTVFSITSGGAFMVLHSFNGVDGANPDAGVIQGADGSLYGLTSFGGADSLGPFTGLGTAFKITTGGALTVLHYFNGADGANPVAALDLGGDGNFYGMTPNGGTADQGTIFQLVTAQGPQTLSAIIVTPAAATVHAGTSQQFTAMALDQNGGPMSPQPAIAWSVSGGGSINSSSGLFTANNTPGSSGTVTAASGAVTGAASVTIDVNPVLPGAFVSPSSISLNTGATQQFTALSVDSNGTSLPSQPAFTWSVSGGGTINASGLFTAGANAGGPFRVTATSGSQSATALVTINFIPVVTAITVGPSTSTISPGGTQQYAATAYDQNGAPMASQPAFAWSVSGGGTISSSGLFTASNTANGTFTVTAAAGGKTGTAAVTVHLVQAPTSITVSPLSATVAPGGAQQFTATLRDQIGNPMAAQPVFTWNVTGGGAINSTGLFTAGSITGGPFTVTATSGAISGNASVKVARYPIIDFNGDGKADLVLQNSTSNQVAIWDLNGANVVGGQFVTPTPPAGWSVVGQGDFNGDGKPDLVLQNSTTRQIAIWYLNGGSLVTGQYISATPAVGWNVVAVADFNNDGKPDLVLQSASTRQVAVWYLNGATVVTGHYLSATPPIGWIAVAAGDFNGDGATDLVLQNSAGHQVAIWLLNGTTITAGLYASAALPVNWRVAGINDYNGDGKPDLLLQNATNNQVAIWYMNGATVVSGGYVASTPPAGWNVVGPK